ncbi:MAG: GxxExxY protein [Desulfobacteraceae bacterium IS3]|nr:MAG: GxxExxY protein [Desulfobacteraceae bacterium IS3]
MIKQEYKHSDITSRIIGCAMTVHKTLGSGFMEVLYQRSLAIEMKLQSIDFSREQEIPVHYKGYEVGSRRADFLVEGKVMLEIKAVNKLEDVHFTQALNYLEASSLEIGLLLNFGAKSLEIKRLINSLNR